MEFHVIVFSKDRAFQLHEYLRTLKLHLSPSSSSHYHLRISVLYHAPPGSRFGASYERVRALHPDVSFHAERSGAEFSAALCELVASSSEATSAAAATAPNVCAGNRFVLFGVDDALFFADFDLGLAAHFMRHRPSHWGFHLKLHPGICWCHPADKRATVPSLQSLRFPVAAGELQARGAPDAPVQQYSEPVLCFDVGGGGSGNDVRGTHDWAYPWELCGTVYRQADAQAMLAALAAQATAATALATSVRGTATAADPLSHPNLLEASGAKLLQGGTTADAVALRRRARVCGCPSRPVMTVVTVNRVQDIFQNRVWPINLSPVAAPPPVAVGGGSGDVLAALDDLLWRNSAERESASVTGAAASPPIWSFDTARYKDLRFRSVHIGTVLLRQDDVEDGGAEACSSTSTSTSTSSSAVQVPPPLISVLLPVRNGERYLRAALCSALSQACSGCGFNLEVISVDDGSTDGTAAILLAEQAAAAAAAAATVAAPRCTEREDFDGDGRVVRFEVIKLGSPAYPQLERRRHGGVCGALRAGVRAARGEFIARLDADDVWLPGRLRTQLRWMLTEEAHDVGVVGCAIELIDETVDDSVSMPASLVGANPSPAAPTAAPAKTFKQLRKEGFSTKEAMALVREHAALGAGASSSVDPMQLALRAALGAGSAPDPPPLVAAAQSGAVMRRKVISYPCDPYLASWSLLFSCTVAHSAVLVRTVALHEAGGYTVAADSAEADACAAQLKTEQVFAHAEDYHLWLRIAFGPAQLLRPRLSERKAVMQRQQQLECALREAEDECSRLPSEAAGGSQAAALASSLARARALAQQRRALLDDDGGLAGSTPVRRWRVANVPDVLVQHRKHKQSVTGSAARRATQQQSALVAASVAMGIALCRTVSYGDADIARDGSAKAVQPHCICTTQDTTSAATAAKATAHQDEGDVALLRRVATAFGLIEDLERVAIERFATVSHPALQVQLAKHGTAACPAILHDAHALSQAELQTQIEKSIRADVEARLGELAMFAISRCGSSSPDAGSMMQRWSDREGQRRLSPSTAGAAHVSAPANRDVGIADLARLAFSSGYL